MKQVLIIGVVLLMLTGIYFWYAQQNKLKQTVDDRYEIVFVEHFQPKMKTYLPYPLTVENTEISFGFPSTFAQVTPKQHAAVVNFLNEIMKSNDNKSFEKYPYLTAPDTIIRLDCKTTTASSFIGIQMYDRFIKTSDGEWIVVEKQLLKNLNQALYAK